MDNQLLLQLVFGYGVLLFTVAWLSERYGHRVTASWWRPLIYSLSIGVYCSSWTFLGAVGQAVTSGWMFVPIYLGPILVFLFGWRFLKRLLVISSRNKVTSIADFIGSRYGKNQRLAAIVALILVVGTLPYIAVQLRGVGIAWNSVSLFGDQLPHYDSTASFVAAMAMAWFALAFGTRVIDGPERLRGMITVVSVESIVKVIAFAALALFAWQVIRGGSVDLSVASPKFETVQFFQPLFFTELFLAAVAIVCLPRQFHVLAVEYNNPNDLRFSRWLVPLYLAVFAIGVFPLAKLGASLFFGHDSISPDSYVLAIPRWASQEALSGLLMLGALSAATGMVVVATIALSIMISNEIIVPVWLRANSSVADTPVRLGNRLRMLRRLSIALVLVMAWALERVLNYTDGLASIGLISFAATAQMLPAVLAGLYWTRGHSSGVLAGIITGTSLWFYCLLLPAILTDAHTLVVHGPWGIGWLAPQNLLGTGWLDPLSHGVIWSVGVNALMFVLVSRRATFSALDYRQTAAFTRLNWVVRAHRIDLEPSGIEVSQLKALTLPLLGEQKTDEMWRSYENMVGHRLLPHDPVPKFAALRTEADLAAIIGAVSAHRAMELLAHQRPIDLQDFVSLVGGSSRQIQFSQTLLQTTLETIPQGISVVDDKLQLVAWNEGYQKMFRYPKRLLYVGCDIEKVYQFNAQRGYLGGDDPDMAVKKRLNLLRGGSTYRIERTLPDGEVVEIRGTPIPNGGYVTTYTDVSEYHQMLDELEEAKDSLEERVVDRTAELEAANINLQRENELRARTEGELKQVYSSRSRFLTAASHDLAQPINAARLFVASVQSKLTGNSSAGTELGEDLEHLDDALSSAEQLIGSLREISRLGSGKEVPKRENVSIDGLLRPLAGEVTALANKKGLELHFQSSSLWVYSDPLMLRRVIQNFLTNAIHYTAQGRVLLGCRRRGDQVALEVWDTGVGVDKVDQEKIFREFHSLRNATGGAKGLGLGLSIAQRIAQLLGHPIEMESELGRGSVFRILVERGQEVVKPQERSVSHDPMLGGLQVLCIDNDHSILQGMQSLLEQWGCGVVTAADLGQALHHWHQDSPPDRVIIDYHLDHETGFDVLEALRYHWQQDLPAVLISADSGEEIRAKAEELGCPFLVKPVAPATLRNVLRRQ